MVIKWIKFVVFAVIAVFLFLVSSASCLIAVPVGFVNQSMGLYIVAHITLAFAYEAVTAAIKAGENRPYRQNEIEKDIKELKEVQEQILECYRDSV